MGWHRHDPHPGLQLMAFDPDAQDMAGAALASATLARGGPPLGGCLGNSWGARGVSATDNGAQHPMVQAAAILKGRLKITPATMVGYPSQSSSVVLANIDAFIATGVRYVWCEWFINEATSGVTVAQSIANLKAGLNKFYAAGVVPIFQTVPPRSDGNNTPVIRGANQQVNDAIWAEYYARPRGSMYVLDAHAILTNLASTVDAPISPAYNADGVHLYDIGAATLGASLAAILDRALPPAQMIAPSQGNTFSRTLNPTGYIGNASLAGTAGTISAAGSNGTLASNFTLSRTIGSTLQAVASKVAGPNGASYQQLVLTNSATGTSNEQLEFGFTSTGVLAAADIVQGFCDMFASGMANVTSAYIYVQGSATGVWRGLTATGSTGDRLPASFDRLATTWEIPLAATETIVCKVVINADCTGAAGSVAGTLTLRSAGIKVLKAGS
jgi:hypothetical protein